jgi:hypothetical protein
MPISTYGVSKSLSLPYETARRARIRLANRGLIEEVAGGGFIVPFRVLSGRPMREFVSEYAALTASFLNALSECQSRN